MNIIYLLISRAFCRIKYNWSFEIYWLLGLCYKFTLHLFFCFRLPKTFMGTRIRELVEMTSEAGVGRSPSWSQLWQRDLLSMNMYSYKAFGVGQEAIVSAHWLLQRARRPSSLLISSENSTSIWTTVTKINSVVATICRAFVQAYTILKCRESKPLLC